MSSPMQLIQQAMAFRQSCQQQNPNANPQQMVQDMMQKGQVSQQAFEQARGMAAMLGFKV